MIHKSETPGLRIVQRAQLAVMAKQNKLRNGFRLEGIEKQTERRRNGEVRLAPAGTGALSLTLDPMAHLDQERLSAQMEEGITGPYVPDVWEVD